jgi:hypothetical protein
MRMNAFKSGHAIMVQHFFRESAKALFDRPRRHSQSRYWSGCALKYACTFSRISFCRNPANSLVLHSDRLQDDGLKRQRDPGSVGARRWEPLRLPSM